jgi:dephospho-CoA kinase
MIISLTGGIATGKSGVTTTLTDLGIPVVDADLVSRQVVEPGTLGHNSIVHVFGKQFLLDSGGIDRAKLGDLVFSNPIKMAALNAIMIALIEEESDKQLRELNEKHSIVVYSAALICENGNADKYRPLIVTECSAENQIERLMKRGTGHGPLTRAEAILRIKTQMPTSQKIDMADFVVNTDNSIEESIEQTITFLFSIYMLYGLKEEQEKLETYLLTGQYDQRKNK